MISPEWVRMMARYNAWQNSGLRRDVQALDPEEAARDRGAFFGSILATCNHLLWGDEIWLSRFAGHARPPGGIRDSMTLTPDVAAWAARREAVDTAITAWGDGLEDCEGEIVWFSGAIGREVGRSRSMLYTHFFNHQTHHRGQIHAMLTAAGARPDDTDLAFMPGLD